MGIIYCATNVITKRHYIGQTVKTLERRKSQHLRHALAGGEQSPRFYAAIRKYGVEAFAWSVVFDDAADGEIDTLEIEAIAVFKALHPQGYNLRTGGTNGRMSEDTKRKIGLAHRGKVVSQLTRDRQSKTKIGKKQSATQAEKHRGAMVALWKTPEFREKMMLGRQHRPPHSEETRAKIARASRGRVKSEEEIAKIRKAHLGVSYVTRYGVQRAEEMKAKISAASKGIPKPKTQAVRDKISATLKARNAKLRESKVG